MTKSTQNFPVGKDLNSITLGKYGNKLSLGNNSIIFTLIFQFDGRALQPEKIVFGNKTINGSPQADWGREATRENVISAVALRSWVVFYTKRDQTRANDYIGNMMKVCPQMGIDAQAPTRFELRDDRTETFIRALRENINPRVSMAPGLLNVFMHNSTEHEITAHDK